MRTFAGRKLGRPSGARRALLRNLAESLLRQERVKTTFPKAREVARFTEKIIAAAKKEGVSAQRIAAEDIHQADVRKKLFEVLVPRYQSRNGGFTQVLRIGPRPGDGSEMALVRLLP